MPPTRDRRIWQHPIVDFKRGRKVRFFFEGQVVEAYEGETIAAALYAIGIDTLTWSPKLGRPRGPFCMIGKCSSCLMTVNGVPNVRTCIEPVADGIRVERQKGLPKVPKGSAPNPPREEAIDTDLVIVGGGPAGLIAAIEAGSRGLDVVLIDEGPRLGGQLIKQTHKFFGSREWFSGYRGFEIAEILERRVRSIRSVRVLSQTTAYGFFKGSVLGAASMGRERRLYRIRFRTALVSTGASENYLVFPGNDLPGVMGAGGAQTLMNVFGIRPAEKALVVGAGNVGLIVAYQLLQAGVSVEAVLEIMPEIGGWFVHAAKLRRYGVPILTRHTIKEVWGCERVEGATVVEVDEKFEHVPGSERDYEVDAVLLAVGLTPDNRLLAQAGAKMVWLPGAGGFVPLRTVFQETTVRNIFVAGDSSGIEEATTAMVEGAIAALTAVERLRGLSHSDEERRRSLVRFLWAEYRAAPVVRRAAEAKRRALLDPEKLEEVISGGGR